MPRIQYETKKLSWQTLAVIQRANEILDEYEAQGYDLTLRQLYYQFVSRGYLANKQSEYKRLGSIVSDGRRAGLIDWDRIVDRTRYLRKTSTWKSPAEIVAACAEHFTIDLWRDQPWRPEVWIEKDALIGILQVACSEHQVPYFSCRGYGSDSEVWSAGRRFAEYLESGQDPIVLHLGDHDPSGIDMSRDLRARIELFSGAPVKVKRLALNMDQVRTFNPPPNPAKEADSRFADYRQHYGDQSWELDALNPDTITGLIKKEIDSLINKPRWQFALKTRNRHRERLRQVASTLEVKP